MNFRRQFVALAAAGVLSLSAAPVFAADTTNATKQPVTPTEAATQTPESISGQGAPTKEEQLVFSVSPYNGHDYANGVFAPRQLDTVYAIADHTNMIDTLKTQVYYWAITQEYMADWFGERKDVDGKLQIWQGDKLLKTLEKTDYNFVMPDGYSGVTDLRVGDAADKAFKDYNDATDAYWKAVDQYYTAQQDYQTTMQKILDEVQKTGKYKNPNDLPKAPTQPTAPTLFATKPVRGFEINLPPGHYTLKLVGADGKVVENGVKNLVTYGPRREGLGMAMIPEFKWTAGFNSDDSSDVLYQDGPKAMYIKPFDEQEYNVLNYTRTTDLDKPLHGAGLSDAWMWVHSTNERSDLKLQILKGGKVVQTVDYAGFYVQQTPGYSLGYNIVPFDPNSDAMKGQQPTFSAYRVFTKEPGNYVLRFVDKDGNVVPGSTRYLHTVDTNISWPLYAIPAFPLLVGLCIFFWRRSLRQVRHSEGSGATAASA